MGTLLGKYILNAKYSDTGCQMEGDGGTKLQHSPWLEASQQASQDIRKGYSGSLLAYVIRSFR